MQHWTCSALLRYKISDFFRSLLDLADVKLIAHHNRNGNLSKQLRLARDGGMDK
jgi:hypothetical protein